MQTDVKDIVTVNPATGATLERYAYMADAEVDGLLDAAVAAFRLWRHRPLDERRKLLHAVAARLRAERGALAERAVREMGKPLVQAIGEVEKCAWACDYFAENAESLLRDAAVETNAARSFVAFRPLGVLFAIMPWNFPYWQVFRAAAPALMAGNTVVLKHADNTTGCALEIERIFTDAGAPRGAFTTLLIDHDRADDRIADDRIAAVTVTGSERAGVAVGAAAGKALKPSVLELGGSDPFLVLADADIDLAVEFAMKARFQNNGQSCIAAKRFVVEERVYDRFLSRFAQAAAEQRVGNPMEEQTQIGPVARADLRDTLHRQITQTVVSGARIVTGGNALEGDGFYFEPTIVADVEPGSPMFVEETFGPAAAVIRARDDDHAIALANDSTFGLGATIWTRDTDHAVRMAAHLEAGMVFINGMVASDPRLPFGGVKHSGYGRELASFGIHAFVNVQTVSIGPEKEP